MKYPVTIKFNQSVSNGTAIVDGNNITDSRDAITVKISIDRSNYEYNDVKEAIKEICQTILLYFD